VVCPGATGAEYATEDQPGIAYEWRVSGGVLASSQGTPSVTVDWGTASDTAFIALKHTNVFRCENDTVLPVRINVQLEPATPIGDTVICLNLTAGNIYAIAPNITSSTYTWNVTGGTVAAGQGTSEATIDWDGTGIHQVSVTESNNADVFCQGQSGTLSVRVFEDMTALGLVQVTLDESDDVDMTVGIYTVERRPQGAMAWDELNANIPVSQTSYVDGSGNFADQAYEYRVLGTNACGEEMVSDADNTILLNGTATEEGSVSEVALVWNPYLGWATGVSGYEIWRRLDDESDYSLYTTVDASTTTFTANIGEDGFEHVYRIRAVGNNGGFSWSNSTSLSFEHALSFYNVFTPNGDGQNETFSIEKLELYPTNELVIYNRWGMEVFRQSQYRNEWNGEGLPNGIYYYQINIAKDNQVFKGSVMILR
jgi:gliding motility-associated-like protein